MRVLTLDIETSPNLAHIWGIWQQNVGINQLLESGEVMCFSASWYDSAIIEFYSTFHHGKEAMVHKAHDFLSEADAVVTYNGFKFDIPHLNREFLQAGLTPPAPYAQIDLLQTVRKKFRFPSNKLDYVCQELGLGGKVGHSGHQLWIDCMAGKAEAWDLMRLYNEQDVEITERLYERLLPWIWSHPSVPLHDVETQPACPNCGSTDLERRGYAYTSVSEYQRYHCRACGKWSRGGKRTDSVDIRGLS